MGEMIIIHNVTRYCDDIYECVASNGVPPTVSRQMRVTVECKSAPFQFDNDVIPRVHVHVTCVTTTEIRPRVTSSWKQAPRITTHTWWQWGYITPGCRCGL